MSSLVWTICSIRDAIRDYDPDFWTIIQYSTGSEFTRLAEERYGVKLSNTIAEFSAPKLLSVVLERKKAA